MKRRDRQSSLHVGGRAPPEEEAAQGAFPSEPRRGDRPEDDFRCPAAAHAPRPDAPAPGFIPFPFLASPPRNIATVPPADASWPLGSRSPRDLLPRSQPAAARRWCDIDFEAREVRRRAEHEKTGYEHVTPLTDEALAALEKARRMGAGTGNAPVLPSPGDAARCVSRFRAFRWWKKAQDARGTGAEVWQRLALAQTQVCQRPDGHAAQGALRAWWLEGCHDGVEVLPEAGCWTTQAGAGRRPEGSRLKSRTAGIIRRESGPINL